MTEVKVPKYLVFEKFVMHVSPQFEAPKDGINNHDLLLGWVQ
jgi:hypothetical protein